MPEEDSGYARRIRRLAEFRATTLTGQPSLRVIGKAAGGVSPTAVTGWLNPDKLAFPKSKDRLTKLIKCVRNEAIRQRVPQDLVDEILDVSAWEDAYTDEAARRNALVGAALSAKLARDALWEEGVGRLVVDYASDPRQLDIHEAIDPGVSGGLPFLPPYVPRPHDEYLAGIVQEAAGGKNTIAVLVGGSSAGKTRACWEAVQTLGGPWRLWRPVSPGWADALLAGLKHVGPHTVIWLDNAQHYLGATGTGEQVAAGLRDLLADASRGPVLILGTIWPRYRKDLTAAPPDGGPDPHAQARTLLAESEVIVPDAFGRAEMNALRRVAGSDPRLTLALNEAADGQVTQYLAGVPALVRHYRAAPPSAKAVIHAAMDAHRLGVHAALPLAFLASAAPGYMTGLQWQQADDGRWLEEALSYAGMPCRGVLGPLTRDKPRAPAVDNGGARYRLADYLEQLGAAERMTELPPDTFWTAAGHTLGAADLHTLSWLAERRGHYRHAAQLARHAVAGGDAGASASLLYLIHSVDRGSSEEAARWLIPYMHLADGRDVSLFVDRLYACGLPQLIEQLLSHAAGHVDVREPKSARAFLQAALKDNAKAAVAAVLDRDIAASAAISDPRDALDLLRVLQEAGAAEQASSLAGRIASGLGAEDAWVAAALRQFGYQQAAAYALSRLTRLIDASDFFAMHRLVDEFSDAELAEHRPSLIQRHARADAVNTVLLDDDDPDVLYLMQTLSKLGASEQLQKLAIRMGRHATAASPGWAVWLEMMARELSFDDQLRSLLPRARPRDLGIGDESIPEWLADSWLQAGDQTSIDELNDLIRSRITGPGTESDPDMLRNVLRLAGTVGLLADLIPQISLSHTAITAWLLAELDHSGAQLSLATLLAREPAAAVELDGANAGDVASLLAQLRSLCQDGEIAVLLGRQPWDKVAVPSARGAAALLTELAAVTASDQVFNFATRAAAEAELDDVPAVCSLLRGFRVTKAAGPLTVLSERAASEVSLASATNVLALLETFTELSLQPAISQLLSRDPAASLPFGNRRSERYVWPGLLKAMKSAGNDDQVKTTARRMAAEADLSLYGTTPQWAKAMRDAGAYEEAQELADRAADCGEFSLYLQIDPDAAASFLFGREPDRTPSRPWNWHDLE